MNPVARLFDKRLKGIRVIELVSLGLLVVMIFWVYLAKAGAGDERAEIAKVEQRIGDERRKVKLLRAEAARLERPQRIEALSQSYLQLKPVDARREARPDDLAQIASRPAAGAAQAAAGPAPAPAPAVEEEGH